MALQKLARPLNPPAAANIRFRKPQTASKHTHSAFRHTVHNRAGRLRAALNFPVGLLLILHLFGDILQQWLLRNRLISKRIPCPAFCFWRMQSHRASDCRQARILLLPSRSSPPHPAQTLRRTTAREAQHDGEKAGEKESRLEIQGGGDLRLSSPADLGWDRCPIESIEDTRVCAAAPPPEPLATF